MPEIGRVPDALRLQRLLAALLQSGVAGIPDSHDQFVLPRQDVVRHVKGEGQVAARVRTEQLTVQPDAALVIDRLEVQQQPLAGPQVANRTDAGTTALLRKQRLADPGKRRLQRERHQDLALPEIG